MNKKSKITLAALSALVLAAVVLILVTLFGKDTTVFGEYNYDSSLRWYETVEDIVIDGKKDDDSWKNINPYIRETKKENRDSVKYKGMESKIQECKAEVYTYFGEEGLFLYAQTDDPVVNTTALSPFVTTAFDFYICDQAALTRLGNLFEVAVTAEGDVKIRVRDKDAVTGKEAWVSQPCIGVKTKAVILKEGYAVEMFLPWTTLNIDKKPEYVQLATALSRRIDETETSERFWEMFDYYTAPIGFINSSTYPLFDKTGYVEFAEGENFAPVHSNIIDLSKDKGENPQVTTLNRNTVTAFMDEEPVKDVYWETTVQIDDFNYTDDPRVGIVLQGEEREDGTYDRVYLLFQLDKKHEGEGYTIKNLIMLPNSNGKNNWEDAQTFNLNSHIENDEFEMAVMKQNGKFSFYLDDILLCERTGIESFNADSKVTCGITSWFVGATFTDYSMETSNLNAIKAKKTAGFVADEHYTAIEFDLLTQSKGYIWSYSKSTNQSSVNFNKSVSGTFNVTTTISDFTPYKEAKDSRQGIVLTKDLGSAGYKRIFVMLTGGKNNNFNKLQIFAINNDDFGDDWNGVTWIADTSIRECKKAELSVSSVNNKVSVYIDGKYITGFSLKDYNMQNPGKVGFSSWKGTVKFSNYSLVSEGKDASTVTTDVNVVKSILQLNDTASADVYAETKVKVADTSTSMWPRTGLRITNEEGKNIDFFLAYDKEKNLTSAMAVEVDADGKDIGKQQSYYIDSIEGDVAKGGIKLAAAKVGDTFYFYVNDVLMGTKTYEGFGANNKVTASLYSKGTESTFSNYSAKTDRAEINATTAKLTDIFVADTKKNTIRFDILSEADGKVTTNENGTWKDSSIVNWYGVSDTKFYAETTVELNKSHATGSANGMVLTSGDNRFFILLSGDEKGITNISCYSMNGDVMDNYNAEKYPNGKVTEYTAKVNLETENKLAVHRDGNQLVIFLNDKVQTVVDLSTVKYPITSASMIGLTAWKAQSTFTEYSLKSGEEAPVLVVKGNAPFTKENVAGWNWESEYDAKENVISVGIAKSDVTKSAQVLTLNEAVETDLYVETVVATSKTRADMWPRVGLRLTNSDGTNVDYVVAYAKNETPTYVELFAIQTDATGADISDTKQIYAITSIKDSVAEEGVKLAVAKKGDTLYFYVNDVLQGTKTYEGFGAEAAVTAKLYSKGTESSFSDYVLTTDVDASIEGKADIFVADTNKSTIYFDLLKEAEGIVTTNETGSWKGSSIVNWNGISATKFYAETTVKLEKSNATGSNSGLVLTSGTDRFFVMLTGTPSGIASLDCYSMRNDVMDNYNATNYPTGKVQEYTTKISLTNENKLAVYRDGNQLYVLINDEVKTCIDLSKVKYPISEASMIGFAAWKSQSTFTNYSVKLGDACPTVTAPTANTNVAGWTATGKYDTANNTISIEAVASDAGITTHVLTLDEAKASDLYVETIVKTAKASTKYWPRAGIRLTNESGTNVDFVIAFTKNETPTFAELFAIMTNAEGADNSATKQNYTVADSVKEAVSGTGVKLAVAKRGDTLYFFINDVLYGTKTYAGFSVNDKVTASLYSKVTETTFSDYSVSEHLESDIAKSTDIVALHTTPGTDIQAETTIKVSDTSTKYWPRVGLRFTNEAGNHVDYFVGYDKAHNINGIMVVPVTNGNDGKITTYALSDDLKASLSTTGLELSAKKVGGTFYLYVNDVLQGTMSYDGFAATDKVTAYLYSKYTDTSFFDYSYSVPAGIGTDITKANDVTPLIATAMTDFYAEAVVKTTQASTSMWPRVGLRLTNNAGTNVDYVVAFTKNATPTYTEFFAIQTNTNGSDISGTKRSYTLDSALQQALTSSGLKLAVAKKGATLYFFANDILVGTTSYSGFGASDAVKVSLYSKGTVSNFTSQSTATAGNTLAYAGDTFASQNVTRKVKITSGVANVEIQMKDTQNTFGYLYFKEKNTKVSAETYIDMTSVASGDSRAGIALINQDKNAQLKCYLYAKQGASNVTKLQIYWENALSRWGTTVADITLPSSLANIGVQNIKMSLLRNGDSYTVCVNNVEVYSGKLSSITGFNITAETETYIGLFGGQRNISFNDYSYKYGDAVGQ